MDDINDGSAARMPAAEALKTPGPWQRAVLHAVSLHQQPKVHTQQVQRDCPSPDQPMAGVLGSADRSRKGI